MADDELLTVREVAARFKMTEQTVRRWIRSGRLRAAMPGGEKLGYRITAAEIEKLLAGGPTLTPEPREPTDGTMTGFERAREG